MEIVISFVNRCTEFSLMCPQSCSPNQARDGQTNSPSVEVELGDHRQPPPANEEQHRQKTSRTQRTAMSGVK